MKKAFLLFFLISFALINKAQVPEKVSYQAVIRNTSNALVTNSAVGMRISILQTTPNGTAVYVETQTPTTNANGLVSVEIGGGTVVSGNFANINWANGPYFIKTETDPNGGTNYNIIGISQLLSVPYALFAEKTNSINGVSIIDTSNINELQTLSILGNTLSISNSNSVQLPELLLNDYAVFYEKQPSGFESQNVLVNNQWSERFLNTTSIINGNSISRTGNNFTLKQGTYFVSINATWAWKDNFNSGDQNYAFKSINKLRIVDSQNNTILNSISHVIPTKFGSLINSGFSNGENYVINLTGIINTQIQDVYRLQHFINFFDFPGSTNPTIFSSGIPASINNEDEIYLDIKIIKIK
jgi:hypothetical protein